MYANSECGKHGEMGLSDFRALPSAPAELRGFRHFECMRFKRVGRVCYYSVMCVHVGVVAGSSGPSVPQQPEKCRRITWSAI